MNRTILSRKSGAVGAGEKRICFRRSGGNITAVARIRSEPGSGPHGQVECSLEVGEGMAMTQMFMQREKQIVGAWEWCMAQVPW